jgi:putative flippase GtrA
MSATGVERGPRKRRARTRGDRTRGARFTAVMAAAAGRLPFGLSRVVSGRLLGFAVISSITFTVDLVLLTTFHGGLRWPLPAAITVSYVLASGLGYFLNRTLNFRSHGAVGPQLTVYAAVVTVNFLTLILGLTTGLAALGLDYRLARLTAAGCECAYTYSALRWLVFRDSGPKNPEAPADPVAMLSARQCDDDAAGQTASGLER